jgi:hypothetical protein
VLGMNDMERLEQTLKLLRESDAHCQAPDSVETRLRAAFRQRHADPAPRWFTRWQWAGALACSFVAAALVWDVMQLRSIEAPHAPVIAASVPTLATPKPQPPQVRKVQVRKPRPVKTVPPTLARAEIEFVALPYAPPLLPEDQGQVIRMRLPRQSIRQLGLPVDEERPFDRVPADILMGEDGVARGIRLVRASDLR